MPGTHRNQLRAPVSRKAMGVLYANTGLEVLTDEEMAAIAEGDENITLIDDGEGGQTLSTTAYAETLPKSLGTYDGAEILETDTNSAGYRVRTENGWKVVDMDDEKLKLATVGGMASPVSKPKFKVNHGTYQGQNVISTKETPAGFQVTFEDGTKRIVDRSEYVPPENRVTLLNEDGSEPIVEPEERNPNIPAEAIWNPQTGVYDMPNGATWNKDGTVASVPKGSAPQFYAGQDASGNDQFASSAEAAAQELAKNDPEGAGNQSGQVMSWFEKLGLGEYFDKGQLANMAVQYLGSRLLGYDHGASATWAIKQYGAQVQQAQQQAVEDRRARQDQYHDLIDKYDEESVLRYIESGNLDDLEGHSAEEQFASYVQGLDNNDFIKMKVPGFEEPMRGIIYKGRYYVDGPNGFVPISAGGFEEWDNTRHNITNIHNFYNDELGNTIDENTPENIQALLKNDGQFFTDYRKWAKDMRQRYGLTIDFMDPDAINTYKLGLQMAARRHISSKKEGETLENPSAYWDAAIYVSQVPGSQNTILMSNESTVDKPEYVDHDATLLMNNKLNDFQDKADENGKTTEQMMEAVWTQWSQGMDDDERKNWSDKATGGSNGFIKWLQSINYEDLDL